MPRLNEISVLEQKWSIVLAICLQARDACFYMYPKTDKLQAFERVLGHSILFLRSAPTVYTVRKNMFPSIKAIIK